MIDFLLYSAILQVYVLPPTYVIAFTYLWVGLVILGVLTRKIKIQRNRLNSWFLVAGGIFLISATLNMVDPISVGASWTLYFLPISVFLGVISLKGSKTRIEGLLRLNGYCIIFQMLVIIYQSISRGYLVWEDAAVGTIARAGVNSHTPGVLMMLNSIVYAFVWHRTRKRLYFIASTGAMLFWVLTSVVHSYFAFVSGLAIFLALRISPRLSRISRILPKVLLVLLCVHLLLIYTQPVQYHALRNHIRSLIGFNFEHFNSFGKYDFYLNTLQLLRDIPFPIFGVGPGMYNSRVAYAKKGTYLTGKAASLNILPPPSEYTKSYMPRKIPKGVANNPFASIIAIFVECGILGLLVMILLGVSIYKNLGRISRVVSDPSVGGLASGLQFFCCTLFFLIFLENWLEYPKIMITFWFFAGLAWARSGDEPHRLHMKPSAVAQLA